MSYPSFENNNLQVSYSSLKTFKSCGTKFEFYKMHGLARHQVPELAPDTGKALHAAFQSWFVHRDENLAVFELLKAYPFEVNTDSYNERSIEAAYATFQSMMMFAALDSYEPVLIKKPDGQATPAIEVPFEIKLKNFYLDETSGTTMSYIGFVDFYAKCLRTGEYVAWDIKTHRNNLLDLTAVYANEDQVIPYQLVLDHALGRYIETMPVNYLSCYVDVQNPKVSEYNFVKDREDLHEWCRTLFDNFSQIKQYYALNWFPKNGGSCMNYRRRCEMFDICGLRGDAKITQLNYQRELFAFEGNKRAEFKPWIVVELDLGL